MSIWKATSFLPQIPFYLDEDLNFTTIYLQSLPSTTTNLNFAGLIPNNSTAFEAIMPQVVDRFSNLENLDLSSNMIVDDSLRVEGLKALITYLPQLKSLQFLRLSRLADLLLFQFNKTDIIAPYYQNLSYTIGRLPNLRSLDLSNTFSFFQILSGKG